MSTRRRDDRSARHPVARTVAALGIPLLLGAPAAASPPGAGGETVVEIRVQGNFSVADDRVVRLAGIAVGDPVGPGLVEAVRRRLDAAGLFDTVEVRPRYRSLTATDAVTIIIVVRERPGAGSTGRLARSVASRLASRMMVLPILDYDEGYGLSYGARTTLVETLGARGRLSMPATWGGRKRVALEADGPPPGRLVHRLRGGAGRSRRRHPAFGLDDDRTAAWVAADRRFPGGLRVTGDAAWEAITFGARRDRLRRYRIGFEYGADITAAFPRDEVMVRAGVEWIDIARLGGVRARPALDVRGFKGVGGQAVLAARVRVDGASAALPRYEQPLLGGGATVRGWGVGAAVGDRLALASLELRLPMSSPLAVGDAGFRLFYDTGAAYDVGRSIHDQRFLQGAGAGVFVAAPVFRLGLDIGHNLRGAARLHVTAGIAW